jgi:hypothetical protein
LSLQKILWEARVVKPKEAGELRLVGGEFLWETEGMLYKYDMETELPGALIGPWDGN